MRPGARSGQSGSPAALIGRAATPRCSSCRPGRGGLGVAATVRRNRIRGSVGLARRRAGQAEKGRLLRSGLGSLRLQPGGGDLEGNGGAGSWSRRGRRVRGVGARGAAGEIHSRCSGSPQSAAPSRTSLSATRARAGRYPSAAEPPPASAAADWRSGSPASHCRPGRLRSLSPSSSPRPRPAMRVQLRAATERAPSLRGLPRGAGDAREGAAGARGSALRAPAASECRRAAADAVPVGSPARPPHPGLLPARPGPAAASVRLSQGPEAQATYLPGASGRLRGRRRPCAPPLRRGRQGGGGDGGATVGDNERSQERGI